MIRKSKSIEQLYEECKGYDLVITNDAPLATALNKLVEEPRLEYLAMTPKQIASKFAQLYYEKIYEKYEVVLMISRLSKRPVKHVHQSIMKIYEVWMYNAKLEFTGEFLSEEESSLIKYLDKIATIETAMENFNEDFYRDKKIAVIGEDLFSLLDLEVLPRRGDPAIKIDIFTDKQFSIEKTYLFSSSEQLIKNITDLINKDNAEDTAIVLDARSDHLEILKARLKEAGIKIEVKNFLSEEVSVRNFISLIELAFRIDELKVKEFTPIAAELGIMIGSFFGQHDMSNYINYVNKDKGLKRLYDISKDVRNYDYKEFIKVLEKSFNFRISAGFEEVLDILEIGDVKIDLTGLLDLKYFLKEFDVETGSERSGVLFVNALNSAFIDRQIIFYLGMDNSWMTLYPDIDYLNKEEEEEKNLKRFQILLQQGRQRFYFVQHIKDYNEVVPCYYFLLLSENEISSFNDDFFNPVIINNKKIRPEYTGKITKFPVEKSDEVKSISPSRFNDYFRCPKYFTFNKILPSEDLAVMKRGNLFHNFAELYFNYPELVKKDSKQIIDMMTNELSLLLKNVNAEFIRSEFQIGTESIVRFIDSLNLHKTKLDSPEAPVRNILMEKLDLKKIYNNTEQWLDNKESTMITGKVDLQSGKTVVDYKSGKTRKKVSEITLQSNLDFINLYESAEFDFQAAAYIAALRNSFNEIDFIYYFLFSNYKNQIHPGNKEQSNATTLKYLPVTFLEHIYTEEVFKLLGNSEKPGRLLEKVGYENYKHILDNLGLNDQDFYDKDLFTNRFLEITNSVLNDIGLEYRSFRCKTQGSLNENFIGPVAAVIHNIRTGKLREGLIFKDDIDKFSDLINKTLEDLNKYFVSKFPFEPAFGSMDICKECNYLNLCIGNKLWH
ncbi:MAG: PD-(D/E)XK nuclease family protein [Ignavibacteria bacterium]